MTRRVTSSKYGVVEAARNIAAHVNAAERLARDGQRGVTEVGALHWSPAAERFDRIGAQRCDSSVTACGATSPSRNDALAAQGCLSSDGGGTARSKPKDGRLAPASMAGDACPKI